MLTPLRNTVFVIPDLVVRKTESGIILPENRVKRPTSGTVIAVGPQVRELQKGDRVVYGEFSGARETMIFDGKEREVLLMSEKDVLAVIDE